MGVLDRFRKDDPRDGVITQLSEALGIEGSNLELVTERLAELEMSLDAQGWTLLNEDGGNEFSAAGRKAIRRMSRLMVVKNPLIGRGVRVKSFYVFGQGVEIQGRSDEVNEVIQSFMDDPSNVEELFGADVREQRERDLATDGEIFFTLFTDTISTGRVQLRTIPCDEIVEIICNPQDRNERWFYVREWVESTFNLETEQLETRNRKAYYPDFRYRPLPGNRKTSIKGNPVFWNSPINHVKVGGFSDWKRGVPDTYAAQDWATAYKRFLEDTATTFRALSRFVYRLTTKGKKVSSAKERLASTVTPDAPRESNPTGTASAFVAREGTELEAMNKSGTYVKAEDGLQFRKQAAAALDIPDTILGADPDMGNLATAKTLDRPTELAMRSRQTIWTGVFRDLCDYVVEWAVRTPNGPLRGTIEQVGTRAVVTLEDVTIDGETAPMDRTIEVNWPPIVNDMKEKIEAIVKASTLGNSKGTPSGHIPNEVIARLLLTNLGVENVDDILEALFDEEGNWVNPPDEPEVDVPEIESKWIEAIGTIKQALEEMKEAA